MTPRTRQAGREPPDASGYRIFYSATPPALDWRKEVLPGTYLPIRFPTGAAAEAVCRLLAAHGFFPLWVEDHRGNRVLKKEAIDRL
ncbi:hypothetical protein [Lichenicoccus sp.]|uniref:hypothetical protein n=1 Tax=Lichenicoccus sp. TaxID=2781899 RepID=UPI003D11A0EF